MYKQQSPISVSSTVWAILVTIIVLLIAASASAQTTDTTSTEPVPADDVNPTNLPTPLPEERMPPAPPAMTEINRPAEEAVPVGTTREATLMNSTWASANASTTDRIQAWREAVENSKERLAEKRLILENSSSTRPAILREVAQERVTSGVSSITTNLKNAISKSIDINTRLQNKATELEGRGSDMTSANALLNEAGELLRLATEALEGISTNAEFAVTSDDPISDWEAVRQQLTEVRDLIKQAHEAMRQASAIIKSNLDQQPTINP